MTTLPEISLSINLDKNLVSSAVELQELVDFYEIAREVSVYSKGVRLMMSSNLKLKLRLRIGKKDERVGTKEEKI